MAENKLIASIHACIKCKSIKSNMKVVTQEKKIPSDYGIVPKDIKIFFVAESPPTSGRYFYHDGPPVSTFRIRLLRMLVEIGLLKNPDLQEFKNRGYYMADTVRCPFQKANNNATPPDPAVKNCRPFLIQEISLYKPKVICALGKTALKAFLNTKHFRLSAYVGKLIEESSLRDEVSQLNIPVFASYFPLSMINWKTKLNAIKNLANLERCKVIFS